MKLYLTEDGPVVEADERFYAVNESDWDALINRADLRSSLEAEIANVAPLAEGAELKLLKPLGSQELWACGVTYQTSKYARMEEAEAAGGGDFYARIYAAERPEIFFKALPHRVVGPGEAIRIRKDSTWDVPEPEITLVINGVGDIIGYTAGDDMSSRSIEGENPLYLPQAKSYEKSAGVGPCIFLLPETGLPDKIGVKLEIFRDGESVFSGTTSSAEMARSFQDLRSYLLQELVFPNGVYLMTGTGIVPDPPFTLHVGDVVEIDIDHVGKLRNTVER